MSKSNFITEERLFAFISTGKGGKMFTLRTMHKGKSPSFMTGEPKTDHKTFYYQSLGTNLHKSIEKGKKLSLKIGLPFKLTASNLDDDTITDESQLTRKLLDHSNWEREKDFLI